ncbi:hypothetical protein OHB05_39890 [Streptomyces sp. NBC_00638]|uniref:hypothetical protein n=1 Tax=unclassified Streptomyces TaxID=2593676 RepID=UPI00224CFF2D|nr:hypothetical protein [Streptomyces sp. NBC_00638]MCX5008693.1 hypothetical protein [Streptomyces sp. NBC_00638]
MITAKSAAKQRHRPAAVRRVAAAAVAGGLALVGVGLTAPAAHAAESDISFSNVVLNNGKPIVVGISAEVEAPLTYTVKSSVALDSWWVEAYRGTYGSNEYMLAISTTRWSCRTSSAGGYTFRDCDETMSIDPDNMPGGNGNNLVNSDAAAWKTLGTAIKKSGSYDTDLLSATVRLQRASRIQNANASPEPVATGKPITVTGTVQHANWSQHRYDNYGGRLVKLQFKPAGSSTYTTVKSVTASSTGYLKTTVTASQDGTWRWRYSGNTTTGASNSSGDYVDVT